MYYACVVFSASVFALSCPDLIPVLELLSLRYEGNKSFQMIIQFPQFAGRSLRCNRAKLLEGKIGLFLPAQETCTENLKFICLDVLDISLLYAIYRGGVNFAKFHCDHSCNIDVAYM